MSLKGLCTSRFVAFIGFNLLIYPPEFVHEITGLELDTLKGLQAEL